MSVKGRSALKFIYDTAKQRGICARRGARKTIVVRSSVCHQTVCWCAVQDSLSEGCFVGLGSCELRKYGDVAWLTSTASRSGLSHAAIEVRTEIPQIDHDSSNHGCHRV